MSSYLTALCAQLLLWFIFLLHPAPHPVHLKGPRGATPTRLAWAVTVHSLYSEDELMKWQWKNMPQANYYIFLCFKTWKFKQNFESLRKDRGQILTLFKKIQFRQLELFCKFQENRLLLNHSYFSSINTQPQNTKQKTENKKPKTKNIKHKT